MAESVENLVLAQLREMRAEMAEMRSEIANAGREVRDSLKTINAKVGGVALLLSMLAGYAYGLATQIERLDETRGG